MGFGSNLKEILKHKGITIKELSKRTGISINTLYSITKRDTKKPDDEIMSKIAHALDMSDELFYYTTSMNDITFSDSDFENMSNNDSLRWVLNNMCEELNNDALVILLVKAANLIQIDRYKSDYGKYVDKTMRQTGRYNLDSEKNRDKTNK